MHRILKTYNVVLLIINSISVFVGAIIVWAAEEEFWPGFGVLVGGAIYIIFIYVLLGTIAETGEKAEVIETLLKERGSSKDDGSSETGNSSYISKLTGINNSNSSNVRPGANEWKCRFCGRINNNYTGTCACGHSKEESKNAI